jgi:hypothetical protein
MKRTSHLLAGPALALLLLAAPQARADYFYNFSPVDFPTVLSDHSGMQINVNNQPQIGPISTGHDSNVVATTLTTFINPGVSGTDTFSQGQHSTIALTITDGTQHATVDFGLTFSGSLSATTSEIKVAFSGPSTQVVTVNGHAYTIKLDSIVPPGVPGAIAGSVGGEILAGVQVTTTGTGTTSTGTTSTGTTGTGTTSNAGTSNGGTTGGGTTGGGTTSTANAPEPSSLVLSALGLSFLGVVCWRRRRPTPAAAA